MVDKISIVVHVLSMRMFFKLFVDKICLPRYENRSTNLCALPFNNKMVPSWLKDMNYLKKTLVYFGIYSVLFCSSKEKYL